MALLMLSARLLNHVGSELVDFFLVHPLAPAHFAALVWVVLCAYLAVDHWAHRRE